MGARSRARYAWMWRPGRPLCTPTCPSSSRVTSSPRPCRCRTSRRAPASARPTARGRVGQPGAPRTSRAIRPGFPRPSSSRCCGAGGRRCPAAVARTGVPSRTSYRSSPERSPSPNHASPGSTPSSRASMAPGEVKPRRFGSLGRQVVTAFDTTKRAKESVQHSRFGIFFATQSPVRSAVRYLFEIAFSPVLSHVFDTTCHVLRLISAFLPFLPEEPAPDSLRAKRRSSCHASYPRHARRLPHRAARRGARVHLPGVPVLQGEPIALTRRSGPRRASRRTFVPFSPNVPIIPPEKRLRTHQS